VQNAAKGSVQDSVKILFGVGKAVQRHDSLLAAVQSSPCKELIVSMLQAASRNEPVYRNSFRVSQICVAQYTLQISCEQFWQRMPEKCIEEWNDRASCSVVYAYGKLFHMKAEHPASDGIKALQHKIVAYHAPQWDAQAVGNAAWSLSKQGLLVGDAAVHLQEATVRTAVAMDPQHVANTL
jgi:Pyruvate/2-oxoacid:ferredoxin oxidoreductase delta subunit